MEWFLFKILSLLASSRVARSYILSFFQGVIFFLSFFLSFSFFLIYFILLKFFYYILGWYLVGVHKFVSLLIWTLIGLLKTYGGLTGLRPIQLVDLWSFQAEIRQKSELDQQKRKRYQFWKYIHFNKAGY